MHHSVKFEGINLLVLCISSLQSSSVRKTKNLVQEYLGIIEIYRDRMYILNRLENYEVCVETVIERNKHLMTR